MPVTVLVLLGYLAVLVALAICWWGKIQPGERQASHRLVRRRANHRCRRRPDVVIGPRAPAPPTNRDPVAVAPVPAGTDVRVRAADDFTAEISEGRHSQEPIYQRVSSREYPADFLLRLLCRRTYNGRK